MQDGGKYCLLAGAGTLAFRPRILSTNLSYPSGSIFLLAILAVAKLRSRVRDVELTSEIVQRISQLMRNPRQGTLPIIVSFGTPAEYF
jgi:hypothetical protein